MTTDNNRPKDAPVPDETLVAASEALKSRDVPAGPSPTLIDRTLSAIEAETSAASTAHSEPAQPFLSRRFLMKSLSTAACLALVAGVLYVAQPTGTAFAAVVEKIKDAKTLSYESVTYPRGAEAKPLTMQTLIDGQGRTRTEMTSLAGQTVTITNPTTGESVVINEAAKSVIRISMETKSSPQMSPTDWIDTFRTADPNMSTKLGEKTVEGTKCRGHRVDAVGGNAFDVWVDVATDDLVLISYAPASFAKMLTKIEMKNFEINKPMDEALFSTAIPPGYTEQSFHVPEQRGDEIDGIAAALKFYTGKMDNKFPDDLINWGEMIPKISTQMGKELVGENGQPNKKAMDELMAFAANLGRITPYVTQAGKSNYAYVGEGKTVGNGDEIIFWIRKDDKVRAIFDDFSIREVGEDEIE